MLYKRQVWFLGGKFQQRQKREKTTFTPSQKEEEKNQADKSAGPIARLNLIIQTHAISSSSVSYAARLMFNHFRNVYFAKRNWIEMVRERDILAPSFGFFFYRNLMCVQRSFRTDCHFHHKLYDKIQTDFFQRKFAKYNYLSYIKKKLYYRLYRY